MIIYVASYPRSGNSVVELMLRGAFNQFFTDIHGPRTLKTLKQDYRTTNCRELGEYASVIEYYPNLLWNKWIAVFDLSIPPHTKNCRYILGGCKNLLTPLNRMKLAEEKTLFVLKTHELPYDYFFDGEYVIQPIRNPGAVFRSYFKFLMTRKQTRPYYKRIYDLLINQYFLTMNHVIKGNVPFGSWSSFHQKWVDAKSQLGDRYLSLNFQEMTTNHQKVCEQISLTLNLDYNAKWQPPKFDKLKISNSLHRTFGKNENWEEYFSLAQLRLIWETHKKTMEYFGYSEPDYTQAMQKNIM